MFVQFAQSSFTLHMPPNLTGLSNQMWAAEETDQLLVDEFYISVRVSVLKQQVFSGEK